MMKRMEKKREFFGLPIMFWGLSNEILIGGICQELVDNHHDLQKLVRELDPTRLTTIAHVSNTPVDGPMHHITDVESYNHYFGWYGGKMEQNGPWLDKFHADHPDICIGISEYGCEGIINWHSNTPECKDYTEEYQALYHGTGLRGPSLGVGFPRLEHVRLRLRCT